MRLVTEHDFRLLRTADGRRLRVRQDLTEVDVLSKAYARGKIRVLDHLYFYAPGVLGLYYARKSERAAANARAYYISNCGGVLTGPAAGPWGEFDGIILFSPSIPEAIPGVFFRARRKVRRHRARNC